jgi:hypothetical protein
LRRSRKTGHFSSQLEVPSAQPGSYTEDIPQKAHILAVCGAKFAAIRLYRALSAAQGRCDRLWRGFKRHPGRPLTAASIAEITGTIPYEILCGIGKRVPRVYTA